MTRPRESLTADDRGVDDIIGFVLTFSIVLTAVGFTATIGNEQLDEFQAGEQMNNAERAMELTAENMEALEDDSAVRRESFFNLNGGAVNVVPASDSASPSIEVTVRRTDPDPGNPPTISDKSWTFDTGVLRYEQDRGTIAYENGALFRKGRTGDAVPLAAPRLLCKDTGSGDHAAVVSIVRIALSPDSGRSISGDVTAKVNMTLKSRSLRFPTKQKHFANNDKVEVEISSPRSSGWQQTLTRKGSEWQQAGSSYECPNVDAVYVRITVVEITLSK